MPKSLLDIAIERGAKPDKDDSYSMGELEKFGIPILTHCSYCPTTLGCYNAYLDHDGFIVCRDHAPEE